MPTSDVDSELVVRSLAGDRQAFRVLVERYQGALRGFVRGRVGGGESAEEIAQEAFVRAFTQLGGLQKREAFFPWLLGIAERVVRETRRSAARRNLVVTRFAADNRMRLQAAPAEEVDLESEGELVRAVAGLPEPYRQVILLRYHGGLSCGEIAQRLEMPVGSVTKVLSRAYGLLRAALTPAIADERAKERAVNHEL